MPALAIAMLALVAVAIGAGIWLEYIPPFGATTYLRIRNGTLIIQRGQVLAHAREAASEILRSRKIMAGFIAITADKRMHFSRQVPAEIRQRLRNVLLNQ